MGMMEYAQSIMIENVKNGVLRKFPLLGTTMSQLDFVPDYNRKTAATDGENVFWSPKFFEELSYDQKVFVVAHEVMHVAFNHLIRRQDKDRKIWNKATDAVINQMLFAKGLPKIDRIIDLKDAIDKSSEYMYERLLKEKEERKSQKMNRDKSQGQGGDGEPIDSDEFDDDEDEFDAHASHDEWDEVFKKIENENVYITIYANSILQKRDFVNTFGEINPCSICKFFQNIKKYMIIAPLDPIFLKFS